MSAFATAGLDASTSSSPTTTATVVVSAVPSPDSSCNVTTSTNLGLIVALVVGAYLGGRLHQLLGGKHRGIFLELPTKRGSHD